MTMCLQSIPFFLIKLLRYSTPDNWFSFATSKSTISMLFTSPVRMPQLWFLNFEFSKYFLVCSRVVFCHSFIQGDFPSLGQPSPFDVSGTTIFPRSYHWSCFDRFGCISIHLIECVFIYQADLSINLVMSITTNIEAIQKVFLTHSISHVNHLLVFVMNFVFVSALFVFSHHESSWVDQSKPKYHHLNS